MSDTKLKPCPFCGEMPRMVDDTGVLMIKCINPVCQAYDFDEIGYNAWNSRPIEDEQGKLIEKLGEMLIWVDKAEAYTFDYDETKQTDNIKDNVYKALKEYKEWKDKHAT